MGCWYRPELNTISSIWYCLFFVVLQGYLLYIGLARYSALAEGGWPNAKDQPTSLLPVYVAFHGLIIALLPFFVFSAIFKVGNLANDGERIAEKQPPVIRTSGSRCCMRLKACWIHGLPVSQTVHLIIATAFLVCSSLVETELVREENTLHMDDVWFTELSFLHGSPGYGASQKSDWNNSEQELKKPPLLVSVRTFGVSLPFVNYISALVAFAIAYPSVFWRANRAFSFVFSCHLMIHAVTAVFCFVAYSTLRRIYITGYADQNGYSTPFLLQEPYLLILYVATAAVMLLASVVVYSYGYTKFCLSSLMKRGQYRVQQKVYSIYCEGYSSHISAIVTLVMMVLCKAPTLYDLMVLYQHQSQVVLLSCIVADVCYLFMWILLWLSLTLKRDWAFNVQHSPTEIGNLLELRTDEGRECSNTSIIVFSKELAFATDSECQKAAIIKEVQKSGRFKALDDVYWLKPQKNDLHASQAVIVSSKALACNKNDRKPSASKISISSRDIEPRDGEGFSTLPQRPADSYSQLPENLYASNRDLVTTFGTLPKVEKDKQFPSHATQFYRKDCSSLENAMFSLNERDTPYATIQRTTKSQGPISANASDARKVSAIRNRDSVEDNASQRSSYANLPGPRMGSWDGGGSNRHSGKPPTAKTALAQRPQHSLPQIQSPLERHGRHPPPPPFEAGPYCATIETVGSTGDSPMTVPIRRSPKHSLSFERAKQHDRLSLDKPKVPIGDSLSPPGVTRKSESHNDVFLPKAAACKLPQAGVGSKAPDVSWNVNPLYRMQPPRNYQNVFETPTTSSKQDETTSRDTLAKFTTSITGTIVLGKYKRILKSKKYPHTDDTLCLLLRGITKEINAPFLNHAVWIDFAVGNRKATVESSS
uniref:Protein tincar n=1 Tax=Trichuris muris TaxID=70415 RepID=A0A5S6QK96_TRIMR